LTDKETLDSEYARVSAERDALKAEQTKLADHNKILASELKKAMTTHTDGNQQLQSLSRQYQELQERASRDVEDLQNTNNLLLQQTAELQQKLGAASNQVI